MGHALLLQRCCILELVLQLPLRASHLRYVTYRSYVTSMPDTVDRSQGRRRNVLPIQPRPPIPTIRAAYGCAPRGEQGAHPSAIQSA